jgi:FHA domain/ABC-2 type transporter
VTGPGELEVAVGDRAHRFAPPEPVLVGRRPSCDVVVDDPLVSREHAEVTVTGGAWHWHDRSSQGSWVDGERRAAIPVLAPVTVHLGRPDGPAVTLRPVVDTGPAPEPRATGWLAALGHELARQARALVADRGRLALALLPGPVLALLLVAVVRGGFDEPGTAPDLTFDPGGFAAWYQALPAARLAVLGLVVASVATGVLAGFRMLAARHGGHAPPPSATVLAALVLLAAVAVLEAAVITLIAVPPQDGPASALAFGRPLVAIGVVVFLTVLASAALGLAVSTVIRRARPAVVTAVAVVVVSLALSGAVVDLTALPGLAPASWLTPGRWGTQALASAVDLRRLDQACVATDLEPVVLPAGVQVPAWPAACPEGWQHLQGALWDALLPLAMLVAFFGALTYLVVRRRQPHQQLRAASAAETHEP